MKALRIAALTAASLAGQQLPPVLILPAPPPADPQAEYWAAMRSDFALRVEAYCRAQQEYAAAFNQLMAARNEKWSRKQARQVLRLREKAERLGDRVFDHPAYSK